MTSPAALETQALATELCISEAPNQDEALQRAIQSAELYMRAMEVATDDHEKARLKAKCQALLRRAESLKKAAQGLKAPISTRSFTTKEQVILLEGSRLNGFVFRMWESDPDPEEFHLRDGEELFTDTAELGLSERQQKLFDGWKRPNESFPLLNESAAARSTMTCGTRIDLAQDVTTDCSVVASLCALAVRAERGHSKLLCSIIFPYDQSKQVPLLSASGRYIFKLYFNGCFRKVVIDDRLPCSRTTRLLHVIDRNNPQLIWPALLEKAYLKVRGGYDFPGSNSGTDLGLLTGWIPEQIFLQSDDIIPGQLWRRVYSSFHYGDVMATLGTGGLARREEAELGLASEHDYAVLDMKSIGHHRLLLVKNPWSQGTVWKGTTYGSNMEPGMSWTEELRLELPGVDTPFPGTFWIDLNDVMQHFKSIYLNWNPGLFTHRQDLHFQWDLTNACPSAGCFGGNPQYSVLCETGSLVWVLLNRHFKTDEIRSNTALSGDTSVSGPKLGFISLYVFSHHGRRVFMSDGALHRGPYVDSPQTLLQFEIPPGSAHTIVVSQQNLSPSPHAFSLSFFSHSAVSVVPATDPYPNTTTRRSAWTSATAGGNATSPSYPVNPQFALRLPCKSSLCLLLETTNPDLSIHVKLVWANGQRVTAITTRDIVGESGEYRRGCALAELPNVAPGAYTIVCSTFEPMQLGEFTLRVGADTPNATVVPIPAESAGRLSTVLPPARFNASDGRLLAPLRAAFLTKLKVIARYPFRVTGARAPLKLSLELSQGPLKSTLAVSGGGEFSDAPMGVRIEDVDVGPAMDGRGGVWVVLEKLGLGDGGEVQVEILSDRRVWVGGWGVGQC
ncbi:MAG: cysteine protease [Geoglossum simile]|nr:MAG: cysteine protease [Geoglossum simile]